MSYSLRNSEVNDQPWLESLRREVYKDLFDQTWGGWDEERHQRQFSACLERGHIQIIEISASPVGMVQMFESHEEIEIGEFQISPSHQRQGLGAKILGDIIEQAQQSSKNLILSTGLKNAGALKLYKRLGFKEAERSETHVHMMYNHE
jgi:ribosomal protein S18 acetylase RimI-like enzyme